MRAGRGCAFQIPGGCVFADSWGLYFFRFLGVSLCSDSWRLRLFPLVALAPYSVLLSFGTIQIELDTYTKQNS